MSSYRELWRLLDFRERRGFVLAQLLALVMATFTLAGVAAVVPFFAVLSDRHLIRRNALLGWLYQHLGFSSEHHFVIALGVGVLLIVLLGNTVNMVGTLALNRFAYRVGQRLAVALFDEYLHRSLQFHLASNSATLFNNIIWEVTRGTSGILQSFLLLVTHTATSALIIGSIVIIHPLIAALAAAALCGSYGAVYVLARQRLLRNGVLESRYTEERTRIATEAFGAIRELLVVHGQEFFRERFARSSAGLTRAALDTTAIAHSPRYILETIMAAVLVAAAVVAINQGRSAGEWLAQLSFLGFAAYRLLPSLQQIFHGLVKIRGDRAAFAHIAADLRAACRAEGRYPGKAPESWHGRPHERIELKGVRFSYAPDRPPAVQVADVTIPAGATVALVGPSGSGKSTLAELMLGLLTPDAGVIEVDGIALDAGNCADWHSTVAYVPQHVFLFDASLAENIALAKESRQIDLVRLREVLRLARLDEFVSTLPGGPRAVVGEHGVRLSGGQRQRVGIARALYRRASLLVLDEPTSALDGLTEDEVMETIEALRGHCTIILIAHRASAVRRCDLIFELAGGTVIGAGTYGELARRSERFERLMHGAEPRAPHPLRDRAGGVAFHKE